MEKYLCARCGKKMIAAGNSLLLQKGEKDLPCCFECLDTWQRMRLRWLKEDRKFLLQMERWERTERLVEGVAFAYGVMVFLLFLGLIVRECLR